MIAGPQGRRTCPSCSGQRPGGQGETSFFSGLTRPRSGRAHSGTDLGPSVDGGGGCGAGLLC
jgi:hypothetical protein